MGGVSERPTQGNRRGAILSRALVATVKGTLIHRMPAAFAGCRTSVGLGQSVSSVCSGSLPLRAVGLATRGCPLVAAGGERRRCTPSVRTRLGKRANKRAPCTRTRPSLGPETRARQSALNSSGQKPKEVSRTVRYRGRANLRKREEPAPRFDRTDVARLAACHRSRKRGRA